MKIFVQCIFKCKRCTFATKTTLNIFKSQQIKSSYDIEILKSYLESTEGYEFIKGLQQQFDCITDDDLADPLNSENIRSLLFELDVIEGQLQCDKCKLIYAIKDSILDTVDCIEPK